MRRWAFVPVSVAFAIGIATLAVLSAQTAAITIDVPNHVRDRVDAAARLAVADYTEWLGPPPFDRLSIGDEDGVSVRVPLWDSAATMTIESQVADGIARAWLARSKTNEPWVIGAAGYLQSRVVERLFNRVFMTAGHHYDASCFFNCHVRWPYRSLPLSRWQNPPNRMSAVFASLERELGWPMLQGALHAVATSGSSDPIGAMSAATGRDLKPMFDAAGLQSDPAVVSFTSAAATGCGSPCYRTHVSVASRGSVPLALRMRVSFADGREIETAWQGRSRVTFESAAPAVAVRLDPDRVWLLDANPLNNARLEPRDTNVPISKWLARWITWLQDAMLTQTFPV